MLSPKHCRAVVEHSEKRKLPGVIVANFHAVPGAGLAASVTEAEVNDAFESKGRMFFVRLEVKNI
jgi:hypothetical protein